MPKERIYYSARHLLAALQQLDEEFLDLPLILAHGKDLQKPNLVQGFVPAPVFVDRKAVESKKPSLLMLGELTDKKSSAEKDGKDAKASKAKNGQGAKSGKSAKAKNGQGAKSAKSAKAKNGKGQKSAKVAKAKGGKAGKSGG